MKHSFKIDDMLTLTIDGTTLQIRDNYGRLQSHNDFPAHVDFECGCYEWREDDHLHRDGDLPAIVHADGHREWWLEGLQHRDRYRPAVIHPDGEVEYWIDGEDKTPPRDWERR